MVESIKELRKICYKGSSKRRPLYNELFTMKFTIYITKFLLSTPVRANHVTMLMILLVLIGSGMMAFGPIWVMFIGITLIHFTNFLDSVDGEISRYYQEGDLTGIFLEELYHTLLIPLMFFSFGYGIYTQTGNGLPVVFGFLSAVFGSPIVLTSIKTAVVKEAMDKFESKEDFMAKKHLLPKKKIDVKGGDTELGKKLYHLYEGLKELLGFTLNMVGIHMIIATELLNYYFNFMPSFILSLVYIIIYGSASFLRQFISFMVHYKGKTVFHYYNALFGKK